MPRGLLQLGIAVRGDLRKFSETSAERIRTGAMHGADRFRAFAKLDVRRATRAALGDRAANTWRDEVYPKGAKQSWHPTVMLWSKWPIPIRAHGEGATIVSPRGVMLAIPTNNVPFKGRRPMTPQEVQDAFDQELIFVRGARSTLAFIDKTLRGRLKRWRKRGGEAPKARRKNMVLMFVLVRQTTLRPRIPTIEQIEADLAPVFNRYQAEEIARALAA